MSERVADRNLRKSGTRAEMGPGQAWAWRKYPCGDVEEQSRTGETRPGEREEHVTAFEHENRCVRRPTDAPEAIEVAQLDKNIR